MTTRIEQFSQAFTTRKRDDGDKFTTLRKDAPDWMSDVVREAHGDMMPDDWRYKMISECADALTGYDPSDWRDSDFEICDGLVDVYHSELLEWLSSHGGRVTFIDEAREEGLLADDADEMTRIQVGQFGEYREILASLISEFEDDDPDDDDSDDEDDDEDEGDSPLHPDDPDNTPTPDNPVAAPLGNVFTADTPMLSPGAWWAHLRTRG